MDRYRHIIPDWEEFLRIINTPMPSTLRVNLLRITPRELRERLEARGFQVEVASWCPYLFKVHGDVSLGTMFEFWLGYYYVQEATSLLAPLALSPQPGERILDICAAPGGKTTHIAMLMGNRGTIVANDLKAKRLRALMGNIYKHNVLNALVVGYNGMFIPTPHERFDRALVDVPCSAEGNVRKSPEQRMGATVRYVRRISGVQKGLLLKAIDLVKPGGVIVYSTCTFAPEENEMVVQHALRKRAVCLEPLRLDVPYAPGLAQWDGTSFHPDMHYCARIYPHHFDSGGGFVARLRKVSDDACAIEPPQPLREPVATPADESSIKRLLEYLYERFGIEPRAFNDLRFVADSNSMWVTYADADWLFDYLRLTSVGLRIAHCMDGRFKPTSYALMWLHKHITKSIIEVDTNTLQQLLLGQSVKMRCDCTRGYVALAYRGEIIGCGFYTGDELRCEMPKGRRAGLLDVLRVEEPSKTAIL